MSLNYGEKAEIAELQAQGNSAHDIAAVTDLPLAEVIEFVQSREDDADRYQIKRFYMDGRGSTVVKSGLTLEDARAHCNDSATHGADWFDGYEEM